MKAVVATQFGGPDVLTYTDMDQPQAGPGQVLIKVEACSVNFSDIKTRRGSKGNGKVPYVPGIDAAGIITEVGENVYGLTAGQRVIAFPKGGAYAEYAVAPANLTFPISEKVDFLTAAAAPIASFTAYQLLADVARIQAGETVLVHAAGGGVGTTAIQLAKLLGAGKVIGTVSKDEKAAVVLEAGADHVINRSAEDFAKKTLEFTNGAGVDIVLDSIAGDVPEKSLDCLAMFGRIVHFGNAGGKSGLIQTKELHASCRSVRGFSFGTVRKHKPELVQPVASQIIRYLEEERLNMMVGHTYKLADAAKSHALIEERKSKGKIVLIPPHSELNQSLQL